MSKFEQKFPDAKTDDQLKLEETVILKNKKLGSCVICQSITRWFDLTFQCNICSDECLKKMWEGYNDHKKPKKDYHEERFGAIKEEMVAAEGVQDKWKDIIIVVHNQLDYMKECIESIRKWTHRYNLYIWDNGSDEDMKFYLRSLVNEYCYYMGKDEPIDWSVEVMTSEANIGFIEPNNELVTWGSGEYIILINSDCKVYEGWDKAMLGWLQKHEHCALVGYIGGLLDHEGKGNNGGHGWDIDYVGGWCLAMPRKLYDKHGLFNKQLQFAYCEDTDLSLRMKASGYKIYALHAPLVHHYGNQTIKAVHKEGKLDVESSFNRNHEWLKQTWKNYLEHDRVLLHKPDPTLTDRPVF